MPGARAVFWAALAIGATCSAVGGFAAERWTLDGVDPYYFGPSASEPGHRSSSAFPVADSASDAPAATYAPEPASYFAAREAPSEALVAVDADRWQRQADAEDRRWQARMDADFRREQRLADVAREDDPDPNDRAASAASIPRAQDVSLPSSSDAAPASVRETRADAEDPA